MVDKIKKYLQSEDLELVNLGLSCLPNYTFNELSELVSPKFRLVQKEDGSIVAEDNILDFGCLDIWAMKRKTASPLLKLSIENSETIYATEDGYKFELPRNSTKDTGE